MKFYFSFFLLLCVGPVLAFVPTVETLFRNGSNADVSSHLVSLKLKVTESIPTSNASDSMTNQESYINLFLNVSEDGNHKVLLLTYDNSMMNEKSQKNYQYYSNFKMRFKEETPWDVNKNLFYSLLFSLVFNRSEEMSQFLEQETSDFTRNQKLLLVEKIVLLKRYKEYLSKIEANPRLRNSLESPLIHRDLEERRRLRKLFTENLFSNTNQIQLIKEETSFYWEVKLSNMLMHFISDNHQFAKLRYQNNSTEFRLECSEYTLFDGIHEFPKFMQIKTIQNRVYSVQVLELKHLNTTLGNLLKTIGNQKSQMGLNPDFL